MSISRDDHRIVSGIIEGIIGCSFQIHNQMGFGFLESVYEKCLYIELNRQGLKTERQAPLKVYYRNECVGDYCADLVVEGLVVVELKSMIQLAKIHEAQLVNYLNAIRIDTGLLLNFGPEQVDVRRKFRLYKPPQTH